jgi:hypothetical protein
LLKAIPLTDNSNSKVGELEKLIEYKAAKRTHYNNSSPKLTINKDNES